MHLLLCDSDFELWHYRKVLRHTFILFHLSLFLNHQTLSYLNHLLAIEKVLSSHFYTKINNLKQNETNRLPSKACLSCLLSNYWNFLLIDSMVYNLLMSSGLLLSIYSVLIRLIYSFFVLQYSNSFSLY